MQGINTQDILAQLGLGADPNQAFFLKKMMRDAAPLQQFDPLHVQRSRTRQPRMRYSRKTRARM